MIAEKSTHKELFDLKNTKDLPKGVVAQISKSAGRPANKTRAMLELFDLKDCLSTDEIIVGLYRKYGIKRTKKALHTVIHHLIKKGTLKKLHRGCYAKV